MLKLERHPPHIRGMGEKGRVFEGWMVDGKPNIVERG
jgi:hypothetical protein